MKNWNLSPFLWELQVKIADNVIFTNNEITLSVQLMYKRTFIYFVLLMRINICTIMKRRPFLFLPYRTSPFGQSATHWIIQLTFLVFILWIGVCLVDSAIYLMNNRGTVISMPVWKISRLQSWEAMWRCNVPAMHLEALQPGPLLSFFLLWQAFSLHMSLRFLSLTCKGLLLTMK